MFEQCMCSHLKQTACIQGMPVLYAERQEVVSSNQWALRRTTSELADRRSCSACNLKKGILSPVAWLWLKDGVLRFHFALKTGSQINRSLSAELYCTKSIRSNMTLSLISLLYKDIAELWLLLKKSTGVSSFSNFLSYLIAGQAGTLSDNIIILREMGCVLVQRAEVVLFLCTFIHKCSLLLWVYVFCPCINLQCILLLVDIFLSTSDVSTLPLFYTQGTLFRIHSHSDYGDQNRC